MALGGGVLGSGMGARGAASHGELDLSDGGGGDLPKVASRDGTRLAEGLNGGRPKGHRREARGRLERGPVVGRSSGSQLADQRGPGVAVHGGSVMAITTAQWWQKGGGGRWCSTGGGGANFYSRRRRLVKGGASGGQG
jgi:hypothetical protein